MSLTHCGHQGCGQMCKKLLAEREKGYASGYEQGKFDAQMDDRYLKNMMTGQEWLSRFVDELGKPEYFHDETTGLVTGYKQSDVGKVARIASGVDQ